MIYLKLFLFVLVGSIGMWFAVYRLVASTDEMTKTFSYDTGAEARAKIEAKKENKQQPQASEPDNRASKISGEIITAPARTDSADEQALVAELVSVIEVETAEEVRVDENAAIEEDEQQASKQNSDPELSKTERADSDADIQAASKSDNGSVTTSQAEVSQIKPQELDKNLPDPTKLSDAIKKTDSETVRAIDIAYALPPGSTCVIPGDDKYPSIGVHYRPSSYAIKGQSLTNIDKVIAVYKKCGGKLLIVDNKIDTEESDNNLIQLRQDEVKYYLLQRRVPKDDMVFSES